VSRVRAFAGFCYDFIVGDDWRIALGVVLGLAVTWVLSHSGVSAWWALPVVAAVVLGLSLARARRAVPPPSRS
jgi:hypothetical protein